MFADNFVEPSPGVLIDPVLQVALSGGRFDLGDATQWVRLAHDPEIRPDRLTQPLTPSQQQLHRLLRRPVPETTAFRSARSRTLFDFLFAVTYRGDLLEARLLLEARHLPTQYSLIAKYGPPAGAADPRGFHRYVLSASLRLSTWDTHGTTFKRVEVYVPADVHRALWGTLGTGGDPAPDVLLGSRALGREPA